MPAGGTGTERSPREQRRARWLLAAGAALGIGLAASGVLAPSRDAGLGPGAAARVNQVEIPRVAWERRLERLATERRSPVDDAARALVLERMIEEELLVQRAVEIGLLRSHPPVRKALVSALIAGIVSEAESRDAPEAELRRFHRENRGFFGSPARLRVWRIAFLDRAGGAEGRARTAARAIGEGLAFADARSRYGDAPVLPLPDVPLPPHKLREYVGPSAADAVATLPSGGTSAPLRGPAGWQLLRLVEREPARVPRFEDVEAQVRAEHRRRAGDEALRRYLERLRAQAEVELADGVPE